MKKFLVVVLALIMAFAFCGAAMAAQEVVFWNVLTGNGGELMQRWAEEFNASQSDYYINMTYSGSYEESLAKYQSTTKGNRPDVVMVSTEYVAFFADNPDYFVPVQKYIDEDNYDVTDIMANLRASYSDSDGNMMCMPIGNTVVGFMYNNKVLKEHGIDIKDINSYEDLKDASDKLKAEGVKYPFYLARNSIYYTFPVTAEGLDYVDNNNGKDALCTRTLMDEEPLHSVTVKFFSLIADMAKADEIAPISLATADARQMFVDGDIAFLCSTISGTNAIGTLANWELDFGFHPAVTVSRGAENVGQCTGGGTLFLGNNGNPAAERGAWEFLKYILEPQNTSAFALATGYLPTTVSGFETEVYQDYKNNRFPTAQDAFDAQQATGPDVYNAWLPMFGDFHQIMNDSFVELLENPDMDIEDFVAELTANENECIELYALQK